MIMLVCLKTQFVPPHNACARDARMLYLALVSHHWPARQFNPIGVTPMIKVVFLHAHAQAEFVTDAMILASGALDAIDHATDLPSRIEGVGRIIECALVVQQHRGSFPYIFEISDRLCPAFEEISEYQDMRLAEAMKSDNRFATVGYGVTE